MRECAGVCESVREYAGECGSVWECVHIDRRMAKNVRSCQVELKYDIILVVKG